MDSDQFLTDGAQPSSGRIGDLAWRGVAGLLALLLALMVAAVTWQIAARYLISAPSMVTEEFLRFSLIWLALVGAGFAFARNQHMNLPMVIDMLPPRGQHFLAHVNALICLVFGGVLIWGGITSVGNNAAMVTPMLQVSVGLIQSVLVVCGAMIVLTQVAAMRRLVRTEPSLAMLLAAVATVLVSGLLVGMLWRSAFMARLVETNLELTSTIVLFVVSTILLLIGTPILVGLALAGVLTLGLQLDMGLVLPTVGETMFNGIDSFGSWRSPSSSSPAIS